MDGRRHEDYAGYDGEENIGRIYLDRQTLKAGQWFWAGQHPKGTVRPIMPHSGWLPTAADAARQVEEYWDKMKARLSD